MRKLTLGVFISVLIISCGGIHAPFSYAKNDGVTETGGNFVKLVNGNKVSTKKIQFIKKEFILDKQTINAEDVVAFQSGERYASRISEKNHYYIDRIVKGKINVYINPSNDDGKLTAHYFVQKGQEWPLKKMTPEVLREMTIDNEDAYSIVKNMKNIVTNNPKMEKAIKIYNE